MDPMTLLVMVPITLMAGWIRVLSVRLNKMSETTYTKDETQEMIKLHQEPLNVKIENIDKNTSEMKRMLEKVLDDRKDK